MKIETIHEVTAVYLPPPGYCKVQIEVNEHGEISLSIISNRTHQTLCVQMYQPMLDMIHTAIADYIRAQTQ